MIGCNTRVTRSMLMDSLIHGTKIGLWTRVGDQNEQGTFIVGRVHDIALESGNMPAQHFNITIIGQNETGVAYVHTVD